MASDGADKVLEQKNADEEAKKDDNAIKMLVAIYKQSPLAFRSRLQNMLKPHKEAIMKWGEENNSDNNITKEQLVEFLDGKMSKLLVEIVFTMIYAAKDADKKAKKGDTETISRVEFLRFANGYRTKKHVRAVTVKDAGWVLGKLQKTTFADIDNNDEMKIDLKKFTDYLISQDIQLSEERIADIFNEIDAKSTGKISVVAYEKWRSKQQADKFVDTLNK